MSQNTILVIDDDPVLVRLIEYNLKDAGYVVFTTNNGQCGLKQFYEHKPALVVLDINMPAMDGWTTCQRIREVSDTPIIMLTAQVQKEDIVKGLDLGADDYMTKPFEVEVLLARIRANIRRHTTQETAVRDAVTYADNYLSINLSERRVCKNGIPIRLTKTEFGLLSQLLKVAPKVATFEHLLKSVWGFEYIDDIDYLRVYIWHLRKKIEKDSKQPVYIQNEPGVGYRFEKQRL